MEEKVFYVQFNQDFSSLGVGTGHGWSLESVVSVDKLERIHEALAPEGVRIVERLFSSSLVAIVSSQSPRKLRVCHFKKGNEICNYSYANTILAVRLNRARLVVCLEEMLYIHNIRDMKILHTIRDTPANPNGILGLSVNADNSYLAYPGSATTGQVQVFDAFNLQAKIVIHAHASTLASLVFNMAGTLLATASEKGTVIRIFSTDDGIRLFEFRRGMRRYASICSIAFSPDNAFLAVSSNTETVHVFLLQQPQDPKEEATTNSWVEWMKASLPSQVTDVWAQGRAYATITTPFHGTQSVVAVTNIQGADGPKVRVLVASYDGFLYIYGLNTQEGGECPLLKQHRLVEDSDSKNKSSANVGSSASYAGVVKGGTPQCMSVHNKWLYSQIKIYGFFGDICDTECDFGQKVNIGEACESMAGFSEYRSFQSQQDQIYSPSSYGYNIDYMPSLPGQHIFDHRREYLPNEDSNRFGLPQEPIVRRNLQLSFSSTQSNISPDSPDDLATKSSAYRGLGLMGLVADHLLSHPLLVIRRQCQVHVHSSRYHLFPVTLIYPAARICQWQGLSVLWKGLGSTLVVKGMALAVEDITSKITPWPNVSLAVITPFYSASLVETVQSEVASETAGFFDVFREGLWRLLSWPHTGRMVPLYVLVIPTVAHGILSYVTYSSIKSVSLSTIKRVRECKERKQGALSKDSELSYYMEMTASLIGHMVADALLFPLETILHRLHLQGTRTIIDSLDTGLEVTPIITSYNGVLDCIRTTIEDEGFSGLYKGFGALVLQYGLQILLIRTVKIVIEKTSVGKSAEKQYPADCGQANSFTHQPILDPIVPQTSFTSPPHNQTNQKKII